MYGQLGVHPSRGATLGQTDKVCAEADYHTFLDVPYSTASFWNYIEAIENAGITLGCSVGFYCPNNQIQRAEMAVFLVRAKHGAAFVPPPATGTVFTDVPADYWAAAHIEQLFRDGITQGCAVNPRRYCTTGNVTRAEMATFLTRVKYGVDYVPPTAQGALPGRAAQLLGVGLDRADVSRRRDQRLLGHRAAVLPGGQGDPLADGEVPGGGVQPAAAAVGRAPSGPRSGC